MKKVAVVVLHYKEPQLTKQCLESLRRLKAKNIKLEIIVVDNSSVEPVDELFINELKKKKNKLVNSLTRNKSIIKYIKNKKNLGFAEGNNVGIRRALKNGADYVLILNNDTTVAPDLLLQLTKVAGSDRRIGVVAPKIYFAPGFEYHRTRYKPSERGRVFWYAGGQIDWQNMLISHRGVDEVDIGQYDQQTETPFISGCAMMVKHKVFEKVGLFDPRYYLYLEDADFCQRAKRAGFKLIFTPRGVVHHFNASSSEVGGPLHDYYLTRNRLLFGMKWAPWRTKAALIRESVGLALTGRKWQRIGVQDYFLKKFGKGSYEES